MLTKSEFRAKLLELLVDGGSFGDKTQRDLWAFYSRYSRLGVSSRQRKATSNLKDAAKRAHDAAKLLERSFRLAAPGVLKTWFQIEDLTQNIETAQEIIEWQSEKPSGERIPVLVAGDLPSALKIYAKRLERHHRIVIDRIDPYQDWFYWAWENFVGKQFGRRRLDRLGALMFKLVFEKETNAVNFKKGRERAARRRQRGLGHPQQRNVVSRPKKRLTRRR